MGGHRIRRKGTMPYDELYNIPCIMKLPAGMERKRATVEDVVISTDLSGALLDLAGLEAPGSFGDSDVTRALRRDAPTGNERAFFEHYAAWWGHHPFYGVRTATRKYVYYYGDDEGEELYDLEKDPDELCNVAQDPAYRTDCETLSEEAHAWWKKTNGKTFAYYESDEFKDNLNKC